MSSFVASSRQGVARILNGLKFSRPFVLSCTCRFLSKQSRTLSSKFRRHIFPCRSLSSYISVVRHTTSLLRVLETCLRDLFDVRRDCTILYDITTTSIRYSVRPRRHVHVIVTRFGSLKQDQSFPCNLESSLLKII